MESPSINFVPPPLFAIIRLQDSSGRMNEAPRSYVIRRNKPLDKISHLDLAGRLRFTDLHV